MTIVVDSRNIPLKEANYVLAKTLTFLKRREKAANYKKLERRKARL